MDLAEQFAAVWARRAALLVVAFLAAATVFVWRSSAPEVYEATSTLQVRVPDSESSDPSGQVDYYAQTVTGLVTSRGVVSEAMDAVGRTGSVTDVADEVAAEAATEPGFVAISATGATPEEAVALTDALVETVTQRIADDQAADQAAERDALVTAIAQVGRERDALPSGDYAGRAALIRERESLLGTLRASAGRTAWQLATVEPAREPSSPSAPQPLRDGLLAFLLAAILLAEGIVVRRAWRGAVATRNPGRDVGETLGLPAIEVGPDDPPTALAALLPHVQGATSVTVVQRGPRPGAHTAALLAELLAARRQDVLLVDATPERAAVHLEIGVEPVPGLTDLPAEDDRMVTSLETLPRSHRLHVLAAGRPDGGAALARLGRIAKAAPVDRMVVAASAERLDDLAAVLGELDGPVVVDLDPRHVTKSELRSEVRALQGLGADVVAVTVQVGAGFEGRRRDSRRRRGIEFPTAVPAGTARTAGADAEQGE